ncbi:hypothetical protein, partial [Halorubrum sp. SD626R]|uniref:hypothetical protein n=1 Tax=Halorubrum sp. SD626R TaxID=1419722 RepID=UPI0013051149
MPDMHFFTPNELEELLKDAGLSHEYTHGFPVTIYPDVEETQLSGNTASISEILEDDNNYEQILETEWNLLHSTETATRGNNLLAVAHKE